jgi:hypothetical protein
MMQSAHKLTVVAAIVLASVPCGCGWDQGPADDGCTGGMGAVEVVVLANSSRAAPSTPVRLSGTARPATNRTIRRLTVQGVNATNDGFNFDNWSVTLSADVIAGLLSPDAGQQSVDLPVRAYDSCGEARVTKTPAVPIVVGVASSADAGADATAAADGGEAGP